MPAKRKAITAKPGADPRGQSLPQRVAALNRWRESYNPLRGLNIQRAIRLLEDYFAGNMADLQWAYFFIEQTDPDLIALLELRLGRLLEMDWNILTPDEDGIDQKLAEEQEAFLRERCDQLANLYETIEHLAMAPFRGYAHAEKWYGADGYCNHLEIVDQWNVVRDGLVGGWRYNPTAKSTSFAGLSADADMPPEQFIFREARRPINRYALIKFVRANLAEKDWDAFCEIYGIPGGVVVMPPNVPDGKAAEYEAEAQKIAEGGTGSMPHGSDWKPNTAARGTQPFKERLDHLSEKLVLAGTGGKLTMLTEAGSGTLAGGAHAQVFDSIASAEAQRISGVINKQLVAEMLEQAFPGKKALAYWKLAANEETDTGAIVEDISKLAAAGYLVDPGEVTEKTGYTVTLKPAAPDVPPGAGSEISDLKSEIPKPDPIQNRASDGAEVRFFARGLRDIDVASQAALKPLLDRVEAVQTPEDARALLRDLPDLEDQILRDNPQLDEAHINMIATALADGLAKNGGAR